jgi:hypothetical protein
MKGCPVLECVADFDKSAPLRYNVGQIVGERFKVFHHNPSLNQMLNLSRMASGEVVLPCRGVPVVS